MAVNKSHTNCINWYLDIFILFVVEKYTRPIKEDTPKKCVNQLFIRLSLIYLKVCDIKKNLCKI